MTESTTTPDPGSAPEAGKTPDYIERIRSDPDFAEREVRNLKSRYDSTDSTLGKLRNQLGRAKDDLEAGKVHGDDLYQKYNAWRTLEQHPEMGALVRDFALTGTVPKLPNRQNGNAAEASVDDDLMTETERTLKNEVTGLQQKLDEMHRRFETRIGLTETSFGMASLQSNLQQIASEYGMTQPIFDKVKEEVASRVEKSGPDVLQAIMGPKGVSQLRALVKSVLEPDDWQEILSHRERRKQEGLESMSTGGPGMSAEPEQMLDPRKIQGGAAEALRQARMAPSRNPYS